MSNILRAQVGGVVAIRVFARERRTDSLDGRLFALNGIVIGDIKTAAGASIGGTMPVFTYVQDGEYVAHWDASSLAAGDYVVQIEGMVGFDTVTGLGKVVPKRVIFRLLPQGAP